MTDMTETTEIAFTPAVKAMQDALGTRDQIAIIAKRRGFRTEITDDLSAFLAKCDSFFLATATQEGQPYIQHRGGSPGFLTVTGAASLAFADLPGNRQFLTLGNLSENDRVHLFLIDYETATRVKLWGRARAVDLECNRHIEIDVTAWDVNCNKHIPLKYSEETIARATEKLTARIAELERQIEA